MSPNSLKDVSSLSNKRKKGCVLYTNPFGTVEWSLVSLYTPYDLYTLALQFV